jgi:beta-phosphoglucomutase-like phosphatase (HAD superfamily)
MPICALLQPASVAAMTQPQVLDMRRQQRGYEALNVGLVLLAIEDPARVNAWADLPSLLDHLFTEGIPCVVTTRGARAALGHGLQGMAVAQRLPMRICAEDLPDDAPFAAATLLACNRLAMPVRHALVITDGPQGAVGGASAGCIVVALGSPFNQAQLLRTGADLGTANLSEMVPLVHWNALFRNTSCRV